MPLAHVALVRRAAACAVPPLATRGSTRRAICCAAAYRAAEFTPSPYDGCRPDVPDPSMRTLRVGGHATQAGAPLAPDALDSPAVWAYRVEHGIYRLGVSRKVAESLGGIGFVDVAEVGSVLTEGRPFGMVEGLGGMLGLVSSLSGEVVAANTSAVEDPAIALALAPTDGKPWPERGWLVEIDGYLETGDNEDEWEALPGYHS
jgi:glycine cleavage system H lipoate-binding protein